jgi:prophage DNA circulation protein
MTDILVRQLLSASFKGVTFRVRNEIQDPSGRRIILHEYPNSNQRFVEDLGQIPQIFKVEAFIHGANYLTQARALEAKLNESGPGELVLPTFGSFTAYALPHRAEATQNNVGEIKYSLEFALGRPTAGPTTRENEIEDLYDTADNARAEVQIALALLWEQPTTALNIATTNYDILQTVQSMVNQYNRLFNTGSLTAFQDTANRVTRDRGVLLQDGTALANALVQGTPSSPGLWQQASQGIPNGIGTDASLAGVNFGATLSTQSQEIFQIAEEDKQAKGEILSSESFTSFINGWPDTTPIRIERNNNRSCLVHVFRICALLTAYEQAAAATYTTENQVNAVREQLYQAYDVVMREGVEQSAAHTEIMAVPQIRDTVGQVRNIAGEILERKSQNSPGLTTIDLPAPRSSVELAYLLYAEQLTTGAALQERAREVRGLNPTRPNMSLGGTLTIFDRVI